MSSSISQERRASYHLLDESNLVNPIPTKKLVGESVCKAFVGIVVFPSYAFDKYYYNCQKTKNLSNDKNNDNIGVVNDIVSIFRSEIHYTRAFYSGSKSDAKFFPLSAVESRLIFACTGFVQGRFI